MRALLFRLLALAYPRDRTEAVVLNTRYQAAPVGTMSGTVGSLQLQSFARAGSTPALPGKWATRYPRGETDCGTAAHGTGLRGWLDRGVTPGRMRPPFTFVRPHGPQLEVVPSPYPGGTRSPPLTRPTLRGRSPAPTTPPPTTTPSAKNRQSDSAPTHPPRPPRPLPHTTMQPRRARRRRAPHLRSRPPPTFASAGSSGRGRTRGWCTLSSSERTRSMR